MVVAIVNSLTWFELVRWHWLIVLDNISMFQMIGTSFLVYGQRISWLRSSYIQLRSSRLLDYGHHVKSSKFDYGHSFVIFPCPIPEKLQMSAHSATAINTPYTFLSEMRHQHMTESVRVSRANQFRLLPEACPAILKFDYGHRKFDYGHLFTPSELGIPSCRTQSRDWHATGIATWRPLRE